MNLKYILSVFFVFFLIITSVLYFNFTNDLDNFYDEANEKFMSIENVILQIHKEDSILYKRLLIEEKKDLENLEELISKDKSTKNIIVELFTKKEFNLDNSYSSSLDNYLLLEKSRNEIINFHKLNLISTQKNYNSDLNDLLENYDNLMIDTIENFNSNLNDIKKSQLQFKYDLKTSYLFNLFIIIIILFIFFIYLNYTFNRNKQKIKEYQKSSDKNNFILDSDMNKIIKFIKSQNINNMNPTIKDIKFELKVTHPTILSKLKILEKQNKIYFNKIGRNKYIFLK